MSLKKIVVPFLFICLFSLQPFAQNSPKREFRGAWIHTVGQDQYAKMSEASMMDFGTDENVLNISDQYQFGPDLMVCPVYTYKTRNRDVYFPKGAGWYNLYDGTFTVGGSRSTVDAPQERMPVYVCAGSILPVGALVQNTVQPQTDLTIYIYAGKDGQFTLYEDEGTNYNYEKGRFATISLNWNDNTHLLTIADRKGSFAGMANQRTLRLVLVNPAQPSGVDKSPDKVKTILYTGEKITLTLD